MKYDNSSAQSDKVKKMLQLNDGMNAHIKSVWEEYTNKFQPAYVHLHG